jgi:hypothetical protein
MHRVFLPSRWLLASNSCGKAASAFADEKDRPQIRRIFAALAKTADVILTRLYVFAATATPDTRRNNDTP